MDINGMNGAQQRQMVNKVCCCVVDSTGRTADPYFGNCEHDILCVEPFATRAIHGKQSLDQEPDSLSDSTDGPLEPQ